MKSLKIESFTCIICKIILIVLLIAMQLPSLGQSVVYSDDFEASFEGWSTTNWTRDADAALPGSDGNYLHTTSFDDHASNLNVTTTSAVIDLTGYYGLVLNIDVRYNTDVGFYTDGFYIEYSTNGGTNWNLLGDQGEGVNWYNDNEIYNTGIPGWGGDNGGWETAQILLPETLENNSQARFRVVFRSSAIGNDVGIGFDNFTILGFAASTAAPGNVSSNLSLWLKADGPLLNDNGEIDTWADESGNGNHARQTTSASRPLFLDSAINFNPSLQFDDSYIEGAAGFYTREFFVVIDPDFISSSSAETGDVIGYQPGDVGSLELGSSTTQFAGEVITHTIFPADGYRSAFQDPGGEYVLANPIIIGDRWNGTNDGQLIYLNGEQVDNIEVDPDVDYTDFADEQYIIGYGFDFSDDFQGGVAELISYSTKLSDSDKADVETYLAIKYGITLDEDPASSTTNFDYQVDGVTIIWPGTSDATYHSYHHDVAGIGRNIITQGLDQPSSQSINDATIVSMQSPSDLDNGEYLVWGNDDGQNTFTTSDVITGITQRLQRIWRVKETGNVGTVTLNFDITNLSVDKDNTTLNLIVSPSSATMPTDLGDDGVSTLILGGTVSTVGGKDILSFADIDLNDGDFFTIGGDVQTIAPGGVSAGLTLWLRPDDGVSTTAANLVTSWADVSGNGNDADQGDNNEKPTLLENEINFNDAIDFTDDFLDGIAGFNTHDYFLVVKPDLTIQTASDIGFLVGYRNGAFDGLYLGDQGDVANAVVGHAFNTYRSADASGTINGPVTILNSRNNDTSDGQELFANDIQIDDSEQNAGAFGNRTNSFFRLGNNFLETESYDGKIAEVISYNSRLSDSDRRDVVSYLALKYGVTLDISGTPYTVGGVSIYNNTSYANDISGIGINLDHGLIQTSSMSSNSDAIVNMVGGTGLGSGDYVVWGSDATDKTLVQSTEIPGAYDERLSTEWQVDVTGSPGPVTVKVYVGNIDSYANRAQAEGLYTLLVNNTNDFSTTTATYDGSYFSGDTIVFENVNFADNDFFTVSVPAAINLGNVSLWLRADIGTSTTTEGAAVSTWTDQIGSNNATNTGGARPVYRVNAIGNKPAVDFDGTNDLLNGGAGFYSQDYFIVLDPDVTYTYNSGSGAVIGFESGQATSFILGGNITSALTNEVVTHLYRGSANYRSAQLSTVSSYSLPTIFNSSVNSTNNGQDIYANGVQIDNAEANAGTYTNLSNRAYRIGRDLNNDVPYFNGKIAEVISFSVRLTATERRDIESYLALKYGITLNISGTGYTYNNGSNIYNLTGFANDIVGIGANASQAFSQTTSTSINTTSILTISSPSSLNNGDYLVVGRNGGVITSTTSNLPPTVTERATRIWGVTETGDVGTVTLSFNLTGGGYGAYDLSDFSLIVDSDADFTNGTLSIIPAASFNGTTLVFEGVDLSGAVNFSIGTGRDLSTDTDSDGIPDYFEIAYGTDETNGDDPVLEGGNDDNLNGVTPNNGINDTGINGDGISDALEQILIDNGAIGLISRITDTDGDGIPDWLEVADGTNPFNGNQPTASGNADSDGDGIPDAFEAYIANQGGAVNPDLSTDTDGDGVPDYYEVLNNSNPNDVNSPTPSGGTDSDGDGITDALEAILIAGGASAPINLVSDMDGDGIPDYIEALTYTDPFNEDSPGLPATVVNIRSLQADYQVTGGNCIDLNGYQWVHVTDNNGSLVFSINPVGNNLGSTCWAVRILNGEANVRMQTVAGVQDEYVMNRNWWIAPTTQPSSDVYVRFYSLDAEPIDLRDAVVSDGYDPNTLDEFQADSIHFTKISGIDNLNPFVTGGTRSSHQPMVASAGSLGKSYTFGISSFSSFVPHYSPGNDNIALPVELSFFSGRMEENFVSLTWQTMTEQNNEKFIVQRSIDGESFENMGEVNGAGDSSSPLNYDFRDQSPSNGINYYRLMQVDFDGKSSTSSVIAIDAYGMESKWVLYPNPSSDFVNIRLDNAKLLENGFRLSLFDIAGKSYPVDSFVFGSQIKIPVSQLPVGRYTIKMEVLGQTESFSIVVKK